MFTTIYNYCFLNKEKEEIWIDKKLNQWKVDLFSNNKYLNNIPIERIIEKKKELKKQYKT